MARFHVKNALLPLCLGLLVAQTTAKAIGGFHPKPQNGTTPTQFSCGEVNIIFTGLPAFHPILLDQGLDPVLINNSIRHDTDNILKLGYNIRVVLMGPEQDISKLRDLIHAVDSEGQPIPWTGTGVGFGVRGSNREDVTTRFKDIMQTFREETPLHAPTVFDFDPNSASWAIESQFPFVGDCSGTPGRDLGFNVLCDIC